MRHDLIVWVAVALIGVMVAVAILSDFTMLGDYAVNIIE